MNQQSKRKVVSQGLIGMIILLVFATPLMWLVGTQYLEPTLLANGVSWHAVSGTLESVSTKEVASRAVVRGYAVKASYSYVVDDKTYYGSRVGFARTFRVTSASEASAISDSLNDQQPLTVYVDQNDPSRSVLLKDVSGRFPAIVALIFGVPGSALLLCALYVLFKTIRSASL